MNFGYGRRGRVARVRVGVQRREMAFRVILVIMVIVGTRLTTWKTIDWTKDGSCN